MVAILTKKLGVGLALVALMSGCSLVRGSDGETPGPSDPPSTPVASASPVFPEFSNERPCAPVESDALPAGVGCVSAVTYGDHTLFVYAYLSPDGAPEAWAMRLEAPDGGVDQPLDAGLDYPRAVGAADVDRDGDPEWWLKVADYAGHGAAWARLGLFFAGDGALVPLTLDGAPMAINYGGISRLGEGARCIPGGLIRLRAEAQNLRNTRWRVSERTYEIEGTVAHFRDRREHLLVVDNYIDPALRANYHVTCPGSAPLTP